MGHWEEAEGQGAGNKSENKNYLFPPCPLLPLRPLQAFSQS